MATTKHTRSKVAQAVKSGVVGIPRRIPPRTYTPTLFCGNPFDADATAEHSDAVRSAPWLASLGLPPVEAASPKPGFSILCVMPNLETPRAVYEHFDDKKQHLEDQALDAEATGDSAPAIRAEALATMRRRDIAADFNLQLRLMKLAETLGFVVDIVAEKECAVLDVYELRFADRFVDPATYDIVFVDADDCAAMALSRCGAKRVVLVGDQKNQPAAVAPTLTALYRVVHDELMLRRAQLRFDWAAPELPLPHISEDDVAVDKQIILDFGVELT
jgi:hypothetical protein